MNAVVDVAVMDRLRQDTALQALAPGGIYRDYAPENVVDAATNDPTQVFGIVALEAAIDHPTFCAPPPAPEENHYVITFIAPASDPTGAQAASDRAEALLPDLAVPGARVGCSRRVERVSDVLEDGPVRWQYRGVRWLVWVSP